MRWVPEVRPSTSVRSRVLHVDRAPVTRWVNVSVKVALVASFAVAIGLSPDTVEGKAMGFRAPLFLAPVVVVPIVARLRGWEPYPHTADALLAAPFLLDTFGNHMESHMMSELDCRENDRSVLFVVQHIHDERLVYLEFMKRYVLQLRQ